MNAIHILRFEHKILTLCRVLGVNRSSYYKHYSAPVAPRILENRQIKQKILSLYSKTKKRVGYPKMTILLKREYCIHISPGRVYRLMKQMDLPKMSTRKVPKQKTVTSNFSSCQNQLDSFHPDEPNRAWCGDITYIKVGSRFAYLCVVMDLFSRKIIAWKLSRTADASLSCQTLESAIQKRKPTDSLLFHSDQGCQYTAASFRKLLDEHDIIQSFSRKGSPWQNAPVEAFFRFLKHEELDRKTFTSLRELHLCIFEYIEGFYNPFRPHSHNNFLPPNSKEVAFFNI